MGENQGQDINLLTQIKAVEYRQYEFLIVTALGVLGFSIERFDMNQSYQYIWFLIISWLLLLTSVLEGFFQIQWRLAIDVVQYKRRPLKENLSKYTQALAGLATIFDEENGEVVSPKELEKVKANHTDILKRVNADIEKQGHSVYKATLIQVWAFYLGLVLMVVFKILNTLKISW